MSDTLDKASALLAQPQCQNLLTDFTDGQGRSLADRLVAQDVDLQTYLTLIVFVDDSRTRQCAGDALLFTVPGSRVVRICVDRFKETSRNNPFRDERDAIAHIGQGGRRVEERR
jgi:hypothetical protein